MTRFSLSHASPILCLRPLEEYLRARVHALRWIEERVRSKNSEIQKPFIEIASLPDFSLDVNDTAQAAIDFLRLDQYINTANWTSTHLVPPLYRMSSGKTIPVTDVQTVHLQGRTHLQAQIDLTQFDISYEAFRANCSLAEGSFIRLTPCFETPAQGQTVGQLFLGGFTCVLDVLNWDTRAIRLSVIPLRNQDRYRLYGKTAPREETLIFTHATIDESPSDFVAPRVDDRLQQGQGTHVLDWFHPNVAQIPSQTPVEPARLGQYREILETLEISDGNLLDNSQITAAIEGLSARVQLLQGPPGTGKTATTAAATLLRILAQRQIQRVGNRNLGDIVLIAANTHTAVDNLLQRLDGIRERFRNTAEAVGFSLPAIRLSKAHSSVPNRPVGGSVEDFSADSCVKKIKDLRTDAVLIIGGTTASLLKMTNKLNGSAAFRNLPQGFQASTLIVDEASMIVFPHFLSLATLVEEHGEIMLTGDHRQLAPIVAHDWEREDRPPVVLYQPYASAFEAVLKTQQNGNLINSQITRSALSFTFRLPAPIRELLARIYERDGIALKGEPTSYERRRSHETGSPWSVIFSSPAGLYLVLHNEAQSKRSNETEAAIIQEILSTEHELREGSVAVVTPHRAQRSLLRQVLAEHYGSTIDVIDTVERLQGDERPTVIVSATASDPSAIAKNVEFILDLNRSNVAFSRTQARLVVVCARTLLDYIPADYEYYESAMLWKALRELCSEEIECSTVKGYEVKLLSISPPTLDAELFCETG
ncbi:AAA family ATPase [Acaryochloris sp. 'Moss Beach']|uniref:AAA domain-containing protein n=1 Tax=Acaryochloris sp. 'Moss Beach' TaxID=2740837 RepID=UPI001F39CA47|nr:AAA domain-containing protein [Acaryochloris sp. 'Moss Beach']UJB68552.1 AAA family ATPase [Acaryochloris sp. 'Moss Beach']